ncbi:hypothetical protein VTG60DRAFT_500 [Thermothelomyces hinnuleus]
MSIYHELAATSQNLAVYHGKSRGGVKPSCRVHEVRHAQALTKPPKKEEESGTIPPPTDSRPSTGVTIFVSQLRKLHPRRLEGWRKEGQKINTSTISKHGSAISHMQPKAFPHLVFSACGSAAGFGQPSLLVYSGHCIDLLDLGLIRWRWLHRLPAGYLNPHLSSPNSPKLEADDLTRRREPTGQFTGFFFHTEMVSRAEGAEGTFCARRSDRPGFSA